MRVTDDHLCAYLVPTDEKVGPPDAEAMAQLKEFLKTKGIVFGLLEDPVWEEERLVLARGKPPENGKDAFLEWFVKYTPEEAGDKPRVDLRERGLIRCVKEGQKIAKLHPPTPGIPGRDIFGQEIPPRPGQELTVKTNEWVAFNPEDHVFYARKAGVLKVLPNQIAIEPEFFLNGDLNWDTGNIRFYGDKLSLSGDVKRGFRLEAEASTVEILGNVEDETRIFVKGNLLIGGLLHGETSQLYCTGDARIGAIEYAKVKVDQNLVVTDYVLQANLKVGKDLICTEGIGAIVGGEVEAGGSILVQMLGSRANVPTLVKAGFLRDLIQRIEEIKAKLTLLEEQKIPLIRSLRAALPLIKAGQLPEEKIKVYEKIKEKLAQLLAQENALLKEEEELLDRYAQIIKNKIVKVKKTVFAGVKIQIGLKTFTVAQDLPGGVFHILHHQIKFSPFNR